MNRLLILIMTAVFLSGCAAHQIDARRGGIIEDEDDVLRRSVDYLTYLKLKKGAGPLDQDYILLSYRLIGDMVRSDLFADKSERVKIALRDVLNFNPTADVRPAIIHEAVEHELMNTRALWVTDGTQAYDYVLDVELSEIDIKNDDAAEKKALGAMLVLFDLQGNQAGEWFGILKRDKGGISWF